MAGNTLSAKEPDVPDTGQASSTGYVYWIEETLRRELRMRGPFMFPSIAKHPETGRCFEQPKIVNMVDDIEIFVRHKHEAVVTRTMAIGWWAPIVVVGVVGAGLIVAGVSTALVAAGSAGAAGAVAANITTTSLGLAIATFGGLVIQRVVEFKNSVTDVVEVVGARIWTSPPQERVIDSDPIHSVGPLGKEVECPPLATGPR